MIFSKAREWEESFSISKHVGIGHYSDSQEFLSNLCPGYSKRLLYKRTDIYTKGNAAEMKKKTCCKWGQYSLHNKALHSSTISGVQKLCKALESSILRPFLRLKILLSRAFSGN